MAFNPDGSAQNPVAAMAQLRGDQRMLAQLEEGNPRLAK